jgi:hypothetical protein
MIEPAAQQQYVSKSRVYILENKGRSLLFAHEDINTYPITKKFESSLLMKHMAFSKSNLCRSEGACSPRPKSLLAIVETLTALARGASVAYAQGDKFLFVSLLCENHITKQ